MFINPKLHEKFGPEWMVLISISVVLATMILAGACIHVNRSELNQNRRAEVSCFLGVVALALICGIVMWGAN
jgi:uncharacterized membrane protein